MRSIARVDEVGVLEEADSDGAAEVLAGERYETFTVHALAHPVQLVEVGPSAPVTDGNGGVDECRQQCAPAGHGQRLPRVEEATAVFLPVDLLLIGSAAAVNGLAVEALGWRQTSHHLGAGRAGRP